MRVEVGHGDTSGEGHPTGHSHWGEERDGQGSSTYGGAVTALVNVSWVLSELCSKDVPGCQKPSVLLIPEEKSTNPLVPTGLLLGGES